MPPQLRSALLLQFHKLHSNVTITESLPTSTLNYETRTYSTHTERKTVGSYFHHISEDIVENQMAESKSLPLHIDPSIN